MDLNLDIKLGYFHLQFMIKGNFKYTIDNKNGITKFMIKNSPNQFKYITLLNLRGVEHMLMSNFSKPFMTR